MHIVHFLNNPLDIIELVHGGPNLACSGGWMSMLIKELLEKNDYRLSCIAYGAKTETVSALDGRISSYVLPGSWENCGSAMERSLKQSSDLLSSLSPDILHIHGTENSYGLLSARRMVPYPAIVSLQGLMGPCAEWYHYFGKHTAWDVLRMHRIAEFPALRGLLIGYLRFRRMAKREREIVQGNRYYFGRTDWDRAYVRWLNPDAVYYHGGELLRNDFWRVRWSLERIRRHRIIFTNAGHPRKGTEQLLAAAKLLRNDYPDLELAIAGTISKRSGYGRYIRKRIAELGRTAVELGPLSAEQMAAELAASHVFVSPSFIENSSNALCEAQLIGMPVVSSYTGGVPSLIEDNRTGLFFPNGDVPMLAAQVRRVFDNDDLAVRLGRNASETARRRHDPDTVLADILAAYEDVVRRTG